MGERWVHVVGVCALPVLSSAPSRSHPELAASVESTMVQAAHGLVLLGTGQWHPPLGLPLTVRCRWH